MFTLLKNLYLKLSYPQRRSKTADSLESLVNYHLTEGFAVGIGVCAKCAATRFVAIRPENLGELHGCGACWESEPSVVVVPLSAQEWADIFKSEIPGI